MATIDSAHALLHYGDSIKSSIKKPIFTDRQCNRWEVFQGRPAAVLNDSNHENGCILQITRRQWRYLFIRIPEWHPTTTFGCWRPGTAPLISGHLQPMPWTSKTLPTKSIRSYLWTNSIVIILFSLVPLDDIQLSYGNGRPQVWIHHLDEAWIRL